MNGTKERLQVLDCARGVAILAVFFCHSIGTAFSRVELPWSAGWFRSFAVDHSLLTVLPLTLGWTGVAIFFSVSGFCIHLTFMRGVPGDWRGFFIRRFFRIYPPYFLALIVFAFVFTPSRLSILSVDDLAQFGSHALLLHNLDRRSYFGINPAFWSIAVEAQLYLLYPVLLALARRKGWPAALICVGVLEILMRGGAGVYLLNTGERIPRWMIGLPFFYWFSWATGAAVADAYVNGRPLPFRGLPPAVWLALVVATSQVKPLSELTFTCVSLWATSCIARQLDADRPGAIFRYFLNQLFWLGVFDYSVLLVHAVAGGLPWPKPLALFGTCCVATWLTSGADRESSPFATLWRLAGRHLRFLGICSYSFYLLHMPVVVRVPGWLQMLNLTPSGHWASLLTLGGCMLTYPLILGLSWLYYRFCERPSIAVGKMLASNAPQPAPAPEIT